MKLVGGETQVLVDQAVGGDQHAKGELLERLRPRLVLWCGARMSQRLQAKAQPDDVTQEVLLALHKALPRFVPRRDSTFLSWVFRIAENRIRDLADYHGALKRKTLEPRSFSQVAPSVLAARAEMTDKVLRAIESLSEDHRQVIQLRALEEQPFDEVARILHRSRGAVNTLYWRALDALRSEMRKQGTMPAEMPF